MGKRSGFTLAEVLIALALLGIVAAFVIPKVLQTSADNDKAARAKEAMASIYEVYHAAWLKKELVNNATTLSSLLSRLNGSFVTTGKVDVAVPASPGTPIPLGDCATDAGRVCFRLQNGATFTANFDYIYREGTDTSSNPYSLWVTIDPDGRTAGTTSSFGDTISLVLANDGRLYTAGKITRTYARYSVMASGVLTPGDYNDPAWLAR